MHAKVWKPLPYVYLYKTSSFKMIIVYIMGFSEISSAWTSHNIILEKSLLPAPELNISYLMLHSLREVMTWEFGRNTGIVFLGREQHKCEAPGECNKSICAPGPGLTLSEMRKRTPYLQAHLASTFQVFLGYLWQSKRPFALFVFTLLPFLKN